ncbi:MAG: polymerase III, subunit gamma and tau protein [Candidatus Woesebacteria bacterium GW2011_GWA2_40_7b]|uniref:DNA polymerase III subunit gamma/tau n=1 Tax=Candidatus Woesebacteria bacterium GW2011_GWA2_40_7b TaxID=1618563 RepID=A0A0G0VEJ3_9BACT|nr:MAG: polymerase III, subunit gamma and tau protein [Candidatus Woesebacteria bacterium GW2011_GWA2_40_7b]
MTLYLKYRSKNLDELDSDTVRESLKNIVKSGKIPHAFLFAGPKGSGKTSAARILAKIVNCERLTVNGEPCDKCEQCTSISRGNNLDVIEMDAASHRGIDDVRILRDAVKLSPTKAKKKIYIIDEAHMLTTEASNALLKTLEEPPEHVIFILATTNPEKLIDTIRSRVTYILFQKANEEEIVRSLKRVVLGEKIKIKDDALRVVAKTSGGAFRDAIKTLEQITSEGRDLSKESLEEFLFSKKDFDLEKFIKLLVDKNAKEAISGIAKFEKSGVSVENFLTALLGNLRVSLLAKVGMGEDEIPEMSKEDIVFLIDLFGTALRDQAVSPIETLPLEIAVIKWCEGEAGSTLSARNPVQTEISNIREQNAPTVVAGEGVNDGVWKTILSMVKPINASIEALLRAARPIGYDGKTLTLGVFYKFHKERLEDNHHRSVLEEIVAKVLKSPTRVVCTLVEPPPKKIIEEVKTEAVLTEGKDADIIKVAEEIFGN